MAKDEATKSDLAVKAEVQKEQLEEKRVEKVEEKTKKLAKPILPLTSKKKKAAGLMIGCFFFLSFLVGSPFHSIWQFIPLFGMIGFLFYHLKKPLITTANLDDILAENDAADEKEKAERNAERARRKVDLTVEMLSGHELAAKDIGGASDPYAIAKFGGMTFKTKTKKETLNPVWNESFTAFSPDFAREVIHFEVWDKDMLGSPDTMGVAKVVLNRGVEFPLEVELELQEDLRDRMASVAGSIKVRISAKPVK